jgi:lysophospholipase L1-like esterase
VRSPYHRLCRTRGPLVLGTIVACGVVAMVGVAITPPAPSGAHRAMRLAVTGPGEAGWVASWGASPQEAIPGTSAGIGFDARTVREIVFASVGGTHVRVRLTNEFGSRPLWIGRMAIGVQRAGASIARGTNVQLSFAGRPSALIPPHGQATTDPVPFTVAPLQALAVSVYLARPTGAATEHVDAQQTNYVAAGDRVLDTGAGAFETRTHSWYFLDGIDTEGLGHELGALVALGDSITDGVGSRVDANARWPNFLARRLAAASGAGPSVIDEGIGGNRVLHDSPAYGLDAITRFRRDVIGQPGARTVILLEGLNDIGFSQSTSPLTAPHASVSAGQIIAGYRRLIEQGHEADLETIGATLTPFEGARYWTPAAEAKREVINRWVRDSGAFDTVIDFARTLADPLNPERLDPAYDSGDHIHLNDAGYRAMANAIDLRSLRRLRAGPRGSANVDWPT